LHRLIAKVDQLGCIAHGVRFDCGRLHLEDRTFEEDINDVKDLVHTFVRMTTMLEELRESDKESQLVERCLSSMRSFHKISTLDDWNTNNTIEDLIKFFVAFKKATELLIASEYPQAT